MTDVRVVGPDVERAAEVLTPRRWRSSPTCRPASAPSATPCWPPAGARRAEIAAAGTIDFRPGTAEIRDGDWRVPPPPPGLVDRRVEITGPTEPKMAVNALNCGADVWLADLEDANTPHWRNVVGGQVVLRDAVRRTLAFTSPEGREYRLREDGDLPTIVPRPRGWHLPERHLLVDGEPAVGALVDAGLYLFHNAREQLERGSGPYFYLPKMEGHLEAALWALVFDHAEQVLDLPAGSIRATMLIETIPAAFEMEEMLHALGSHATGLNAGRWDYLFSVIKTFRDAGPALRAPRPRRGDDDRADDARLHRPARRRLPPPRRHGDRRDGRRHPQPARRRGQRAGPGQGPRGQDPRGRRRLRRLLGRPPGPGADLPRGVRRRARRPAQPAGPAAARRWR